MIKKIVCLGLLLTIFFFLSGHYHSALAANTNSFQVLVDINQIYPSEAEQATKFAADGVWTIPLNSPQGIDWSKTFDILNAKKWIVSEDNPSSTEMVDFVSSKIGRKVDGAMFYNEDGLATPLTDSQIAAYSSHIVPGFGPVGNRIILLTRSYADGDPRQAQLNHALENPNVAGATFEFNPEGDISYLKFDVGCKHILALGKKCYLLMPPSATTTDFLGDIQKVTNYFANAGLLNNPNVYFVLALYVRQYNKVHFLSTDPNDHNSIESIVKWLNEYRNHKPIGYHDSTANEACRTTGWALDQDTPLTSILVHIYADGPAGSGTLIGGYVANIPRPDVNQVLNIVGNHGFNVTFSPQNPNEAVLFDNKPHSIYVYAIDSQDPINNNALISNSPKTITCSAPPTPTPKPGDLNHDGKVDISDYNLLVVNFGNPYTIFDYNILVANFGRGG